MEVVAITRDLSIPLDELSFSAIRSSGPGGQHVNKVNTKVRLDFDLENSPSLNGEQKNLIRKRLAGRITKEGVLQVSSQRSRYQSKNRDDAIQRFALLLSGALHKRKMRKKTRVPAPSREKRLEAKKKRGLLKQSRGPVTGDGLS